MVPFKDEERRRQYMRDYMKLRRAREPRKRVLNPARALNPGGTVTPLLRIRTAQDVLRVLEQALLEVQALQGLTPSETMQKARTVATVALTVLKALEVGTIENRIAALESIVNGEGKGIC